MKKFSIRAKAFRSFRDEVELEIRPLTLLYGFNQAGKSTLLRLISLLAASLQSDAGPLDLSCLSSDGMSFKELGWLGRNPILSPKISVVAPDVEAMPSIKIQFTEDNGPVVNHIKISSGCDDIFSAYYERIISQGKTEIKAVYVGNYARNEWEGELRFNSMFPEGLPGKAKEIVRNINDAIKPLKRLQWLQANRISSQKSSGKISLCCSADGSDLPDILNTQNGYEVVRKTSDWLRTQEGLGNGISIRQDSQGRLNFVHEADGREQLPLFLSGEGLRSLLPVILCACWAEKGGASAPSMLAVEEIEAHLHPTIQVALFDRLVATVSAGIPVVLETHSVYLLRAMQLAVLEGRLSPDDVSLYWVEQAKDSSSSAYRIEIKEDATLVKWRPDIFEKEQELAQKIFDLRWKGGRGR